jgi:hypothetical protein
MKIFLNKNLAKYASYRIFYIALSPTCFGLDRLTIRGTKYEEMEVFKYTGQRYICVCLSVYHYFTAASYAVVFAVQL